MSNKSSSKFWKKIGLGKKTSSTQVDRPPSIRSQTAIIPSAPRNNEDNRSVKNKRFSGMFLQRKQSVSSVKRICQLSNQNTTPPTELESKQPPSTTYFTSPLPPLPPSSQSTLEYQNYQINHVESTITPLNSDLGIQHDEDSDNTFDVITYDEAQTDEQRIDTTKQIITPTRLVKPTSINELKKGPQLSTSSSSSSLSQKHLQNSKSQLHPLVSTKPHNVTGTESIQMSNTTTTNSSSTSNSPIQSKTNDTNTSQYEKDQLIQQLQDALQTEQSINSVLQGQKEAITRDLDYFSLTVDELMEEKESLVQKYEEEKLKCQSKDQDLNELLDKLRSSTDNARERSKEVDQWKTEIENTKQEATLKQEKLKATLKQKDEEINRLKNEAANRKEEIKILSSRVDQLVQEAIQQKSACNKSRTIIETPSASPQLDAQQYSSNDELHLHDEPTQQTQQQTSIKTNGTRIASQKRVHPASTTTATTSSSNSLDNELLSLTKEKEKLQSDYSKIPLSGGGHTSRRRKEHLEEMLDEVDSQLSKVKQKIRRS